MYTERRVGDDFLAGQIDSNFVTSSLAHRRAEKALRTQNVVEELLYTLSQKDMDSKVCTLIDQVLKGMARNEMYREDSFDLLANTLLSTSSEIVMQQVVPAFLGLCAKVRYYKPSLMNVAGCYAMDNMKCFRHDQLVNLIYSMGQLNHPFPALFSKLETYLLADDTYLKARHIAWMVVWSGMIHAVYPKDLMSVMLQDSYIKGMVT